MIKIELKFIFMAGIFAVGWFGGWLATRLDRAKSPEVFFSYGSSLGAGVFLGAGLIHLLPDSISAYGEVLPHVEYPLAPLLACLGCLMILFLEKVWFAKIEFEKVAEAAAAGGAVFPLALAVALSIHSILAGTALGAEKGLATSLAILVAIVAHKGSAAFALAVSLHRGGYTRGRILKVISLFSLMTPLGVVIGLIFNALLTGAAERLFEAIFDALAAGTFIYIASLDIISEEFSSPERRWPKFISVGSGLGLMAVIALWM